MDIAVSTGIDIFLIAVFIIAVAVSVKKGLVKSLIGLVGNFVAAAAALIFSLLTFIVSIIGMNVFRQSFTLST